MLNISSKATHIPEILKCIPHNLTCGFDGKIPFPLNKRINFNLTGCYTLDLLVSKIKC
jgi:hypothetical protein